MSEIFDIIVRIVQFCWTWLLWLSPLKLLIVRQGELGVRMTFGQPGPSLGPGVHAATTFQTFDSRQAKLCKVHIDDIEFVFKDRVPVLLGAVLTYDITDMGAFLCNSEESEWLLSEIVEAEIRANLSEITFDEYHDNLKSMERDAKKAAQRQISAFELGARLTYVRFNRIIVKDEAAGRALFIDRLVEALNRIPEELRAEPAIGPMVALVAGAMPMNPLSAKFGDPGSVGEDF